MASLQNPTSAPSRSKHLAYFLVFLLAAWCRQAAFACPTIDGLVDWNCDGQLRIVVTGDSVVTGIGDNPRTRGGYPQRLRHLIPDATVVNLGFPGIYSGKLLEKFKQATARKPFASLGRKLIGADLIIIDVGRNDYFAKTEPAFTVRNIKRLINLFRLELANDALLPVPKIAVATLTPTKRAFQRTFINLVNMTLLKLNSGSLPVKIRSDTIDISLISYDGIHPDKDGYDAIGQLAFDYISGSLQTEMLASRHDTDGDGLYDYFEVHKFHTNPNNPDTDGDGISDGQEIVNGTDPLVANPMPTPTP